MLFIVLIFCYFYLRKQKHKKNITEDTSETSYPTYENIEDEKELHHSVTKKEPSQRNNNTQTQKKPNNKAPKPKHHEPITKQTTLYSKPEEATISDNQQKFIEECKNTLLSLILNYTTKHPYFLKKLYELWQQSYNQQNNSHQRSPYLGDKIAMIYAILGHDTIKKAIPTLDSNHLIVLKGQAQTLFHNVEYWQSVYTNTKEDLIKLDNYLNNPDPYQTPFGFIKAMPDSAIVSLLSNKAPHIQSITLAQFDAARCQSLSLHIEPNPDKHKQMSKQIEHYRQYDEYFFQDVAGYLAYSLTQNVFKINTVPIDSLSEKFAEEQSKAETQRALGDLQRQQNLGFINLYPSSKKAVEQPNEQPHHTNPPKTIQDTYPTTPVSHSPPIPSEKEPTLVKEGFSFSLENTHQESSIKTFPTNNPITYDNSTQFNKNPLDNEWFDFGKSDGKSS